MATSIPKTDLTQLDEAWDRMLRVAFGLSHPFTWKLSDLLTNPQFTTMTVAGGGALQVGTADNSGTPGATTINHPSGQVAVPAASSSVVVTNNLVTTKSVILCEIQTADATFTDIHSVVPSNGSFTITGNANATGTTKICFFVVNS